MPVSLLDLAMQLGPAHDQRPRRRRQPPEAPGAGPVSHRRREFSVPEDLRILISRATDGVEPGFLRSQNFLLDDRRTSVRLSPQQRALLDHVAARHGVSVRDLAQTVDRVRGNLSLTRALEAVALQAALELLDDEGRP